MPTVKTATKDSTKGIGAQVLTPRRTRNKSRGQKLESNSADMAKDEDGEGCRSRSRGRRLLDAAVAHISLRRPRSKSKSRSRTRDLVISGPIVVRSMSEVCGQSTLLGPTGHSDGEDEHDMRSADHIYSNESGPQIQPKCYHDHFSPVIDDTKCRPPAHSMSHWSSEENNEEPTILSRVLASRDAYAETRCAACLERVSPKDRYQLIDRVLHRSCFTCSVCGIELSNRSAVCQHGTWSCTRHTQFVTGAS